MNTSLNLSKRGQQLFDEQMRANATRTDQVFAWIMGAQYLVGILWASLQTPYTYMGQVSKVHPHLLAAVVLGAIITFPAIGLGVFRAGASGNKWFMAVSQMLMGSLLIHVSGGRIETHFHVFGSLAFLALYRDWRVLIPATLVVAGDHILRGIYNPMSIYGIPSGAEFRFIEHAMWVVCEDVVLFASCQSAVKEMKSVASRQAELEQINVQIEALVEKRSEQLRAAEFRYSEIIENSIDGIILIDESKCISETNQVAEHVFGCGSSLEGRQFSSLFKDEDGSAIEELFIENNHRERSEFKITKGDGETAPIELGVISVESQGVTTYVAFVRDISEQRKLESKLNQAQKMESIGHMSAGIAHEINTPNQYIGDNVRFVSDSWISIAKLIKEYQSTLSEAKLDDTKLASLKGFEKAADLDFATVEIPSALDQALEGVSRVESIIRAMKEFAHPGGGLEPEVSLNKVVHNSCLISRNEWKYVAKLTESLDPSLPFVTGNPGELGQVVVNLVINAAHAIKDANRGTDGHISVKTYTAGDFVILEITDNGVGIPESAQLRVFEPFYTTKGVGIGTGQGLAITHSVIVDRHQGEIEIDSTVGEGTTIRIKLAIYEEKQLAA